MGSEMCIRDRDRGPMDYTMLIGRKALGRRWVVNPSVSFLTNPNQNK